MIVVLYIIVLIIAVVVDIYISNSFEQIAQEKGYTGYFWWCFFLGLPGWIMVAALPNKKANLPASSDPVHNSSSVSKVEELNRLSALHDKGAISDEEYEKLKGNIMSRP